MCHPALSESANRSIDLTQGRELGFPPQACSQPERVGTLGPRPTAGVRPESTLCCLSTFSEADTLRPMSGQS
jgi:hypothetical protein